MLETKDLCKIYKPKKGAQVTAVDHVSVRFPEKGMVFLLGKSGSGKSTMLNLLGGLDSYDGGEIIIKGISSKNFDQQRFDSYRNTYVGFIFQEYNVLEEFTVGANIALALELQGKKASDEEINHILKEVDLDGFGDRNPNELSGGQKQRVAIARALVKNPEIIMADEPTGALDSNTGRQVLDTLKKLSSDKLIIIVSHDREYAEQYADRIIELADGKIVRDVTANDKDKKTESELIFRSNTVEIPNGYHLTEEDRIRINEYIDKVKSGITMAFQDSSRNFSDTDESVIPVQDGKDFKLIKSVLPMKSAFKIGKSSLNHKKFRLVMTILLSVVAFTLFGFVDTFGSYNHIRTCVDSLVDSKIEYISLSKSFKSGTGKMSWWSNPDNSVTEDDIKQIKDDTGADTVGIFTPRMKNLGFWSNFDTEELYNQNCADYSLSAFGGFAEITEDLINSMGYSVYAGKLPDGSKKEIAISRMAAETFIKAGYRAAKPEKTDAGNYLSEADLGENSSQNVKCEKFSDPLYMVGKTLLIDNELYTVTAVIDTNFDSSRYEVLSDPRTNWLVKTLLSEEFDRVTNYSLTGAAMVGTGAVEKMVEEEPSVYEPENGNVFFDAYGNDKSVNIWSRYIARIQDVSEEDIIWLDKPVDTLAENEIIVSADCITCFVKDKQKNIIPDEGIISSEVVKTLNSFITEAGGMKAEIYSSAAIFNEKTVENIKIVGIFSEKSIYNEQSVFILPDKISEEIIDFREGVYNCVVGAMPDNRTDIENLIDYCYRDGDDVTERYNLYNAVTYELDTVNNVLKAASKVFFGLGIFFAIFASVLMANFISVSINYKKTEIGILRAIGSRSNDVFRIFFSESFIIAVIEFALSVIITFIGVLIVNSVIRNSAGILVTLLHFGIRQIILILLLCVAVAAVASFIPVRSIASRRPIDAIRNR